MRIRDFALFVIIVLAATSIPELAQTAKPSARKPAEATVTENSRRDDSAELAALRSDLQRMQLIVNQMQNNLAFVTSTTTPLKHQFELDVEAWQVLLGQMQRRIQKLESEGKR